MLSGMLSTIRLMSGMPASLTSGLGVLFVRGLSLVPRPPARMTASVKEFNILFGWNSSGGYGYYVVSSEYD